MAYKHDCYGNVWLDGYGNQEHCFGDAVRGLSVSIDCSAYKDIYDDDTTFITVERCPFCGKTAQETALEEGQVPASPKQASFTVIRAE